MMPPALANWRVTKSDRDASPRTRLAAMHVVRAKRSDRKVMHLFSDMLRQRATGGIHPVLA
jgi:hypothetical protein